jgi:site-specific DNA-methyltransferase (adenine-specific)
MTAVFSPHYGVGVISQKHNQKGDFMARSPKNKTITLTPEEEAALIKEFVKRKVYKNEDITDSIFCGDCFKLLDRLPPACADLLVADPPYNLAKTYAGKPFPKKSADEYRAFIRRFLTKARRVLKPNAGIYVCCDWESSLIIGDELSKLFTVKNRITWQRDKGRGAARNWKNSMEDIWYAVVSDNDYIFNIDAVKIRRKVVAPYRENGSPKDWQETPSGRFRDTHPSNFWDDISIPYWSMAENTDHPTQKPEKLFAKLILASTHPGGVVLDPFLGSGTTAVCAKKLGRHYIGIEAEEHYCALAAKRLATADSVIQGYADGVFWERNTAAEQTKYRS